MTLGWVLDFQRALKIAATQSPLRTFSCPEHGGTHGRICGSLLLVFLTILNAFDVFWIWITLWGMYREY